MWAVYSWLYIPVCAFPTVDEAHGRWLQWFTLALCTSTVVLWDLNQTPSTPLHISEVQHSIQPMVMGTQSGKTPLLGAAVMSLGNPTDVISLPGLYSPAPMGLLMRAEVCCLWSKEPVCCAQLHSDTITLSNSTAASLPLAAGTKICFLPARCCLLKRQTHSCYDLLWLHIHMAPSFACSILSQAAINEKLQTLGMSKGFVALSCPVLFL